MATAIQPALDIPVDFGTVSIGDSTSRIGVKVNRDNLNLDAANECFCGRRLTGVVIKGGADESAGQMHLFDGQFPTVNGKFDVKGFRVTPDQIAISLTFSLNDIDVAELAQFSKGKGRLRVDDIGMIPEDDDAYAEDETPEALQADGPWRMVSLSELFHGGLLKSLNNAGLQTVGDLSNYSASEKRLTDIEGIGPGKAEQIENRMLDFWAANPNADEVEAAGETDAEDDSDTEDDE